MITHPSALSEVIATTKSNATTDGQYLDSLPGADG